MPGADAAESILAALDPEQRAVATTLDGPLCVLAGAGTGKTRAITHRIAHGVLVGAYAPRQVLALTFTVRAAGEMRARLRGLGVDGVAARTFHAAALRQARWFWPRVVGVDLPRIVDSKLPLLREAMARVRVAADLRDLASEIEWAKVSNVVPDGYADAAAATHREVAAVDPLTMARVYSAYEAVKGERGVIDMEDILLAAVGLLSAHPGVAEQVRGQYRHLVVDEYQDVSPAQQRLLELWLGGSTQVCVVGDPAQTIYSFAGARADYLVGFPRRYPGATVVRLVRDYRSTPQVVAVANALLANASGATSRGAVNLVAQRPPGPTVRFREYADEPAEAEAVAKAVAALVSAGTPAREVAVLYRVNAQSAAYEQALADAGLPYTVRGGERFFERPEVRQAVTLLRGAARAGEGSPGGLGDDTRAVLATAGWTAQPPAGTGASRERWESLAALASLADDLAAAQPAATLADLVAELDERTAHQHAPPSDAVTLATLHAAKGLEWDAVFVVGCQEGSLPLVHAQTSAEIEEERRLLYVGVTRAREHLQISWSRARTPGGRGTRRPSRFLDGVRPARQGASTGGAASRRASRTVSRCRVCGRPLTTPVERKLARCDACPGDVDAALLGRLLEWRRTVAHAQQVPAYVVLTDATLTAIAESRPTSRAALAALPGIGAVKLDRYGTDVLELCRPVATAHQAGDSSEK